MKLLDLLERSFRDVFAPLDPRSVETWAEDEIILSRRQTETPGPYSTLLTPYVIEPLQSFADPRVTDLTLCFGSQTSKTTTLMIGTAWRIVNNPAPTIWVMPTEHLARSFSENRWQPMVEDCGKLVGVKYSNRFKVLEQQFRDCTMTFVGSNSPANLASRPAGLLIMDETDKFALPSEREAGAVALAENRTKSYTNALRVKASTPTTQEGEIWQAFLEGDQRFYFVPCPHCQHMQKLVWQQVKWSEDAKGEENKWDENVIRQSAYYECESCKGRIENGHKTAMLRNGEWRATNPNAALGRRSYHLNSLYAPWKSCGFGELATLFIRQKSSLLGLQDFVNSALAEPWVEDLEKEQSKPNAASNYMMGDVWDQTMVTFMTVDVQDAGGRHFWVVIRDWSSDGRSRGRWAGRVESWDDLEKVRQDNEVRPSCVFVDSAFATREVYFVCCRFGWVALRGSDNESFTWVDNGRKVMRAYSRPERGDPSGGGGWDTSTLKLRTCPVIKFSKPTTEDVLASLMRAEPAMWEYPSDFPVDWHEHIASTVKRKMRNAITGAVSHKWVVVHSKPNHLRDCENMQVLAALLSKLLSARHDARSQIKAGGKSESV
jgi:hypothetical protein